MANENASSRLHDVLSPREQEVTSLLAQGLSNREIAQLLFVTVDTIKHHVMRACQKAGASNRTQLALNWQRETTKPRE